MKQLLFVLTNFLFFVPIFSQDVKIKDNKATIDGTPYCMIIEDGGLSKRYTIKSLDDKELFFVKAESLIVNGQSVVFYTMTILDTEENFEISLLSLRMGKLLVKTLYENGVIKDNKIDEEGLKKFKIKYKTNLREQYSNRASSPTIVVNQGSKGEYVIVERDTKAAIFVISKTIKQDFKVIGTYTEEKSSENGKLYDIIKIYNSENQLISQINKETFSKEITFITLKDNRKHSVTASSNLTVTVVEAVVKELIEYIYL